MAAMEPFTFASSAQLKLPVAVKVWVPFHVVFGASDEVKLIS